MGWCTKRVFMDMKIFVFILLTLPYIARQVSFCIWTGWLRNGQPGIHYALFRNFYANTCMSVNNVVYGDITVPLQLTFSFVQRRVRQILHSVKMNLSVPLSLRAFLSTFRRKQVSFTFFPRKGFKTHVSKIVQLFSKPLFLRRHKPKMIFGQTTRVDSDRKYKFHRFCSAHSECNNMDHGILSCCQL